MVVVTLFIVCWINILGLIYFSRTDLWPDIGYRLLDYVRTYSGSQLYLPEDHNVSRSDFEIIPEETALAVAPPTALTLPYTFKDDNSSASILVMLSVPITLLLYKVYMLLCRTFKKLRAEDSPDRKQDEDVADEVSFRSPMMTALPDADSGNKTDAVEDSADDDLPPANHSPSEDEAVDEPNEKGNKTAAETSQSDVRDCWEELLEDNPDKEEENGHGTNSAAETSQSDVRDCWEELLEDTPDKEEENGHGTNSKVAKEGRTRTRKRNGLLHVDDDDDDDNYDDEYDYTYDYGESKSTRLFNRSSVKAKEKRDEKPEERKVPVKKYKTKKVKDEMAVPEVIGMDLSLPGILKGSKSHSREERRVTFESPLAFYKTERTEDEIDVHFEVQRVKFKSWELRQLGLQQNRK